MAKPGLVQINTTQTFQNWFDKTNEMVDLFQTSVVTASALGDTTVGDAALAGDFTAANIIADTQMKTDSLAPYSAGAVIGIAGEINIVSPTEKVTATLTHVADGPSLRFTDSTISWDIGFEDNNTTLSSFLSGQVGLIATGNLVVTEIATRYPDKAPVTKFLLKNSPCYVGVMKGDEELLAEVNRLIAKAKIEGALEGLSQKWLKAPFPSDL